MWMSCCLVAIIESQGINLASWSKVSPYHHALELHNFNHHLPNVCQIPFFDGLGAMHTSLQNVSSNVSSTNIISFQLLHEILWKDHFTIFLLQDLKWQKLVHDAPVQRTWAWCQSGHQMALGLSGVTVRNTPVLHDPRPTCSMTQQDFDSCHDLH